MYDFSLRFSGCEIDRPSTLHNFGMFFLALYLCGGFPATNQAASKKKHPPFLKNGRNLHSKQLLSPPLRTAGNDVLCFAPKALGIISPKAQVMRPEKADRGSFHKIPLGKERGTRWFQIFFEKFHPYLGKISNLTNIFQMGWNHQPGEAFSLSWPRFPFGAPRKKDVFLFLFLGRRGGGGKGWLVVWTGVFVAIKRTFEKPFFGHFFFSKNQKSSTNSFWQNFAKRLGPKTSLSELPDLCRAPQEVCPKKNPKQRRWDRSKRCPMGAIIAPW